MTTREAHSLALASRAPDGPQASGALVPFVTIISLGPDRRPTADGPDYPSKGFSRLPLVAGDGPKPRRRVRPAVGKLDSSFLLESQDMPGRTEDAMKCTVSVAV